MANNVFQVKRTTVSGRTPNTTGSYVTNTQYIAAGEFALNMADGILYSSNGTAVIEVGANNTNQRVTGTFLVTNSTANVISAVANGWVGIGNSDPVGKLSVTSEIGTEVMFMLSKHITSATGVQQYQRKSRGTAGTPTIVSNGDGITQMFFQAYDGNSYPSAASLLVSVDGAPVANSNFIPGRILLNTSNGSTAIAERMRITSSGNVGIANSAPDATLAVTGTANISGNFTVGGITTFNANVVLGSSGLSANGGFGSAGQVLTSNGTVGSPYWSTVSGGGGSSVSIGSSPPGSPSSGDLWWNSDQGTMKIYYNDGNSSQWVDSTRGTPGPTGPVYGSRLVASADAASITPNANTTDVVTQLNTQAVGTLTINAATGTPTDGQKLMFRIKSTNIQTLSWNAVYAGGADLTLPSATSGSSLTDYYGFIYNSGATKWHLLSKISGF